MEKVELHLKVLTTDRNRCTEGVKTHESRSQVKPFQSHSGCHPPERTGKSLLGNSPKEQMPNVEPMTTNVSRVNRKNDNKTQKNRIKKLTTIKSNSFIFCYPIKSKKM